MIFASLARFSGIALLLLRLMIAAVFASSGWSHVSRPGERAESIGMSPPATLVLGAAELAGSVSLVLGLYAQVGAALLGLIMLGAIYKKMFVWKTGFWGGESKGWYYDLLYLVCNLVILTAGAGTLAVT